MSLTFRVCFSGTHVYFDIPCHLRCLVIEKSSKRRVCCISQFLNNIGNYWNIYLKMIITQILISAVVCFWVFGGVFITSQIPTLWCHFTFCFELSVCSKAFFLPFSFSHKPNNILLLHPEELYLTIPNYTFNKFKTTVNK